MPIMLLPFFPLATVLMSGICILAADIKCPGVECDDECVSACCCCECCCYCCEDIECDDDMLYDDSSDSFYAYAKKS